MTEATDNTADGISVRLIRLADGTLIDPSTRKPINEGLTARNRGDDGSREEGRVSSDDEADDGSDDEGTGVDIVLRPVHRRSIMDIALNPQQMAFINNVLVYTLWGLPDDEVATMCNCTVHDVHIVRDLDDYRKMYEGLLEGLRAAYTNTVTGIFADAAPKMAKKMIKKADSKSADISIAAMKDILDRAGHRPADRVEHNHAFGFGSELVIRVIKQSEEEKIPTLELNRA